MLLVCIFCGWPWRTRATSYYYRVTLRQLIDHFATTHGRVIPT